MKDRKILKVGSSYMVTLPRDIVRGFGWDENTRIKVKIDPLQRFIQQEKKSIFSWDIRYSLSNSA